MSLIISEAAPNPEFTYGRLRLDGPLNPLDRSGIKVAMLPFEDLDYVFVDMSGASYVDSTVLGCLVHLHEIRRRAGRRCAISITGASASLQRTFLVTGLSRVFNMKDSDFSDISFTRDTYYSANMGGAPNGRL